MIEKYVVEKLVAEWLEGKEYFMTDLTVGADARIVVEIDHADGVWIEDCVDLSRYIESHLDRDAEDFELEVGSAGIGQPFKVHRQYEIHLGDEVEVLTLGGKKQCGTLSDVAGEDFEITYTEKVKTPGDKRPHLEERRQRYRFDEVKHTKYVIDFK